ncbi:single-stranded DNA-binding protein [Salmonirosea aquatica]|uniref:Single-stranded DNA-binding protein n=1 Tax=Salmonirosea aquatica TaxID=2654236 RepID=A0A7C9FYL2_9BACT|nr:single-stranded DNA-binding protein [Cytophagaceae bacterium SJW1-29]
MNSVKLMGNVGREVNVREFEGGKVATFSLATSDTYTNRNQEEVTSTSWHNVVAWGKLAQQCEQLLSKGKFISVEGKLNYRQYQNREDQTVRITEIVAYKIEEVARKMVA